VQPYSGVIVEPTNVASAQDSLGHQFVSVIRHLVLNSGAYHNETDQTAHLATLARYENAAHGGAFTSEDDHAPREDVSERVPPRGQGVAVVPQAAPAAIDYEQLARAIVAVQNQQAGKTDTPVKD
jgi:hypothetical protein